MYSFVLFALLAMAQGNTMTLAEIEAEALANNPEIQSAQERVRVAEAQVFPSLATEDPEFAYRAWGTPLLQPWNLNQTQHMFMFSQKVESRAKRELRYLIADA